MGTLKRFRSEVMSYFNWPYTLSLQVGHKTNATTVVKISLLVDHFFSVDVRMKLTLVYYT